MQDYGYYIFEGGPYRKDYVIDLIEDLGGVVIQEFIMGLDLVMFIAIPRVDLNKFLRLASEFKARLREAKLIGSEIAVVPPSMSFRHLPHPTCDINEYLRRHGAKTFMVGLSRGVGQKRAMLTSYERDFLNEVDAAVFIMGNVSECIKRKSELLRGLRIPVVIVGGPQKVDLSSDVAYVGGLGRISHRLKLSHEVKILDQLVEVLGKILDRRREEFLEDPPPFPPVLLKREVERQIEEVKDVTVLKIDGLRVPLNYDKYHEVVGNVIVEGYRLRDVAEIKRSVLKDQILVKLLPESAIDLVHFNYA
ncbi:MAG: methanogenesis marker 7 protein [Candidatus Nezhaarchaeota archaeon]|nr:methanogenesis marker 7 protein [Candidatus Nezhaarchaeota archaeon]MCX8141662.1 methanogenesis marker 7 protein [Candidatus Nezhaarchaeota archaeon]MDW8049929.1 methyl-coenzyme M reductase family protein [Nitrososphaerota archaeon]